MEKELITIDHAVRLSGISRSTIYRWAKMGRLKIYKIGWFSRIDKSELLYLLNPTIKNENDLSKDQVSQMINKQLKTLQEKIDKGDIDHITYVQIVREMVALEEKIKKAN